MNSVGVNPDLAIERKNATVDVESMKAFWGEIAFGSYDNYKTLMNIRDDIITKIKPLSEENYSNLTRAEKHDLVYKKSLEINEYFNGQIVDGAMSMQVLGLVTIMGRDILLIDRYLFGLHFSAFMNSIDLWATEEQKKYWHNLAEEKPLIGTYVQTELGHGTFLRGLETTATYDASTQEFIIHSPTLTATKFWPGNSGHSANHAIVMANLIIDGKEYGMQAFIVQLRSLEDYKHMPGIESGDIGMKGGFESIDNGYVRFNHVRIPRTNMLMKYSSVSPDGKFSRQGNQMVIYASMLTLRGMLAIYVHNMISISTTIAIRYSCVRRQTANMEGEEQKIIEYQTQQYRLFSALATAYATGFGAYYFIRILKETRTATNNFESITAADLAMFHALTAGLKANGYNTALKFTQSNRLCCGGHGYSAGSGLPQLIQEADAGCSYEGDNVVLLLQTARYLVKCAQNGVSPHFELDSFKQLKSTQIYKYFEKYLHIFNQLHDALLNEIAGRLVKLVKEDGMSHYDAWNSTSSLLINVAKVYITVYINSCNLVAVCSSISSQNQTVLADLFELYLVHEITDTFSGEILRMSVIDSETMQEYRERLYSLLPIIRKNAVALVDAFDWKDSNLNSAIGTYDGRAYERLFEFAQKSQFNKTEVHDAFHKYLRPYALKLKKTNSKL